MIERRLCPNVNGSPSGATMPSPSGPRCASAFNMPDVRAGSRNPTNPAIPHISGGPGRLEVPPAGGPKDRPAYRDPRDRSASHAPASAPRALWPDGKDSKESTAAAWRQERSGEGADRPGRVFRTGLGYAILIRAPPPSAKRRRMTLTPNAMAFLASRRWHRLGNFSPSGLTRHLSGAATHALRRAWLRATIYGRGRPHTALALDYDALRQVVPVATGDDPVMLRMGREALEGRVEILGYGLLDFSCRGVDGGRRIAWNLDPTSGATWPLPSPRVATTGTRGLTGEIKIPWELSRGHHWVALASAYALSRDRSYLDALKEQWKDWLRANPAEHGVNWLVPMEVAIRAINWLWTLSILERATGADCGSDEIRRSLKEHGIFIDARLEYSERPSDHYLGDLVGLLYLGLAFRTSFLGRRWLRLAHSRFL